MTYISIFRRPFKTGISGFGEAGNLTSERQRDPYLEYNLMSKAVPNRCILCGGMMVLSRRTKLVAKGVDEAAQRLQLRDRPLPVPRISVTLM